MSATLDSIYSDDLPFVSQSENCALSNKGKRFLREYIRLYQVSNGSEVTKSTLMQLRGCGERTASEILRWLNTTAMQRLSLLSLNALSLELESSDR